MLNLDLPDCSLAGAIVFYSIIHLAADDLPAAFEQLHRVLRPEGVALIAFHTGRHVVHADDMWGIPVSLDFYFHAPDMVRRLLEDAGMGVEWDLRREPFGSEVQTQRCYLLARRSHIALRPATEADRESCGLSTTPAIGVGLNPFGVGTSSTRIADSTRRSAWPAVPSSSWRVSRSEQ